MRLKGVPKVKRAEVSAWDGLIQRATRELELAKVRVKQLESNIATFREMRGRGEAAPAKDS